MKIKRPRGLTGFEIGLATLLGVLGGIYIWKPLLIRYVAEQEASGRDSDKE